MNELIEFVEFKNPIDLLGETVEIDLVEETYLSWFKILEVGTDEDGFVYITGFDKERMNRKILVTEINRVFKR